MRKLFDCRARDLIPGLATTISEIGYLTIPGRTPNPIDFNRYNKVAIEIQGLILCVSSETVSNIRTLK